MPQRTATFEGKTYTVPDDATDAEVLDFVQSQVKPKATKFEPLRTVEKNGRRQVIPYGADVSSDPSILPFLGGTVAGYATGGTGLLPYVAGQFAGGAAGSAAEDWANSEPVSGGKAAATGALYALPAAALGVLGNAKQLGRSLWSRMSGEARPQITEDILSRKMGAPNPANSQTLYAEDTANRAAQGIASDVETPLKQAANAHYRITKRLPSFMKQVATYSGAGGTIGGLAGGAPGAKAGAVAGGAVGALTHPYTGMKAGQMLYGTPNVVSAVANKIPPMVPAELARQAIFDLINGDR